MLSILNCPVPWTAILLFRTFPVIDSLKFHFMQIDQNTVVTLHYKLHRDDAEGPLIEETYGNDPLTFLYGAGNMIPKFEEELEGKEPGEEFSFGLDKEEAYGDYNEDAVITVPISTFMVEGNLAEDLLQEGRRIPMRDQQGNQLNGTVKEVKKEEVVMDFNHPLAGVDLYFTGEIKEVREASESEVEHGHVH